MEAVLEGHFERSPLAAKTRTELDDVKAICPQCGGPATAETYTSWRDGLAQTITLVRCSPKAGSKRCPPTKTHARKVDDPMPHLSTESRALYKRSPSLQEHTTKGSTPGKLAKLAALLPGIKYSTIGSVVSGGPGSAELIAQIDAAIRQAFGPPAPVPLERDIERDIDQAEEVVTVELPGGDTLVERVPTDPSPPVDELLPRQAIYGHNNIEAVIDPTPVAADPVNPVEVPTEPNILSDRSDWSASDIIQSISGLLTTIPRPLWDYAIDLASLQIQRQDLLAKLRADAKIFCHKD